MDRADTILGAGAGQARAYGNVMYWDVIERPYHPLRWCEQATVRLEDDIFAPDVDAEVVTCAFAVMALCQNMAFDVFTRYPGRMREITGSMFFPGEVDAAKTEIMGDHPHLSSLDMFIGEEGSGYFEDGRLLDDVTIWTPYKAGA